MKKINTFFAALLFSGLVSAQVIPNAGFETWTNNTESSSTYLVPQSWITVDVVQTYFADIFGDPNYGVNAVSRTTSSHSGSYAVHMKVDIADNGLDTVGGVIFSEGSVVDFVEYVFGGPAAGFTSNTRPASLKGFYKMNAQGNDEGVALVIMTKWNTVTNHRDTLMDLENLIFPANASNWTAFTFPLTYAYNENPDTVLIGFGLQTPGSFNMASTLTIDDISFFGNVPIGMTEANSNPVTVNLFPNPVSTTATIQITGTVLDNAAFELYDVTGNRVMRLEGISGTTIEISREGLPSGMYFYNIIGENAVLVNGKISVE